ncbi:hypothetical protein H6G27_34285 [Nostoc linckia FACHB-104]|nr:hypothetical protein [Nostoc linckia FACHB-104]
MELPFYDQLVHTPEKNQAYLVALNEEMRCLLIEMQHGEEVELSSSKDVCAILLPIMETAKSILESK